MPRRTVDENVFEYARKKLGIKRGPFEQRIRALFCTIQNLAEKQDGFKYKKIRRKGYWVKRHYVNEHDAFVLVKRAR